MINEIIVAVQSAKDRSVWIAVRGQPGLLVQWGENRLECYIEGHIAQCPHHAEFVLPTTSAGTDDPYMVKCKDIRFPCWKDIDGVIHTQFKFLRGDFHLHFFTSEQMFLEKYLVDVL